MNLQAVALLPHTVHLATLVCCGIFSLAALAHETDSTIPDPGFRPYSEFAPAFVTSLPNATIAVYPTIVRRIERTAHSFASRELIVASLLEDNVANVVPVTTRIDLGELRFASQWQIFEEDLLAIAEKLKRKKRDANYHLVMEIVLQPGNEKVFGIHCMVLDALGNNAFSFLLNSHHQVFAEANLVARNSSEAARTAMIDAATRLGVDALMAQITKAQECATHTAMSPTVVQAGTVDAFEGPLPAGTDTAGNPIGFVTLSDDSSLIARSKTQDYPTLPPKIGKNTVLRLDMNVTGWAALVHFFENRQVDRWVAYDWRALEQISFWLYGNDSGTRLFFHVLDNRKPCSTVDDAERYSYAFTDDFSGWQRVTIPFTDMVRQDVGNGAPNDGLGLAAVHGWAFGAMNTNGPLTFYVDDVDLEMKPTGHAGYPINELPMFGGLEKTAAQLEADEYFIKLATKGGTSRSQAAESAARIG